MSDPGDPAPQNPYPHLPTPGGHRPAGDPGALDLPYYGIGFGAAIARAFRKYARFSGRASRSEYWWFYLFSSLVYFGLIILAVALGLGTSPDGEELGPAGVPFMVLWVVFMLGTLVPNLAVLSRRLHDANFSALFILLGFIPSIGALLLIVFAALPSNADGVRFDRHARGGPPAGIT